MGTTRSKWLNGILTFFDDVTHEQVLPVAPIVFMDDFLGCEPLLTESGSKGLWKTVEVNLNAAIALVADEPNGALGMVLDSDNNAEDGVLYWGDQRGIDVGHGAIFEACLTLKALPTTGVCAVWGLANDHNLDKDTVAAAAWFRLDASGALDVETDDTTNNNDDVTTGLTLVAGTFNVYRIDFTDLTDVKFYVDGVQVATGTTFDMSNLSAAEQVMQPYISLDKASGTGVGTIQVDYVRIWSKRS